MPSSARALDLARLLAPAREAHQSAVALTAEEVRGYLDTSADAPTDRAAAELGAIGSQYVDVSRFAALVTEEPVINGKAGAVMRASLETLETVAQWNDEAIVRSVPRGGDLWETVRSALAEFGRAFGAARIVRLAQAGAYRRKTHDPWLQAFPFSEWTAAEREMAPPLVVEVDGTDLDVSGLAAFLDGRVKFVLLVAGVAPPASLVRLITPGVFVAQSTDDTLLSRLASWEGPGIVALFTDGSGVARFTHDPAAGDRLSDRLTVQALPEHEPKRRIGAHTVRQQLEELRQLQTLTQASAGPEPATSTTPAAPADPVDKLAAWLLQQADLSGVE